ncbi:MAG: hypothetical protein ACI4QZ_06715, partial [Eubacteriales bacterium]
HFDTHGILSCIDTGLWIIRCNSKENTRELFADQTMRALLGADEKSTPEECYALWHGRIAPDCVSEVDAMISGMTDSDMVMHAEYRWEHSTRGEVVVRFTGKNVERDGSITVCEGLHQIIGDT